MPCHKATVATVMMPFWILPAFVCSSRWNRTFRQVFLILKAALIV